jgi:hypothetical protein
MIHELFESIGQAWKIGGTKRVPQEADIKTTLDRAASVLYSKDVGTRLEVGGLIIEKREHGHDVYVFVGNYI